MGPKDITRPVRPPASSPPSEMQPPGPDGVAGDSTGSSPTPTPAAHRAGNRTGRDISGPTAARQQARYSHAAERHKRGWASCPESYTWIGQSASKAAVRRRPELNRLQPMHRKPVKQAGTRTSTASSPAAGRTARPGAAKKVIHKNNRACQIGRRGIFIDADIYKYGQTMPFMRYTGVFSLISSLKSGRILAQRHYTGWALWLKVRRKVRRRSLGGFTSISSGVPERAMTRCP